MTQRKETTKTGFVLFELLIAISLIAGSITMLHTIYGQLVAKKIQLQKTHAEWVDLSNQYEINLAKQREVISPKRADQDRGRILKNPIATQGLGQ
jgi:type II secretory pathway pseudopilin PulG